MIPQFRSILKDNKAFFLSFLLLVIVSTFICIYYGKAEGFILINPYHSSFLDSLFMFFTWLGDGFFSAGLALMLYILNRKQMGIAAFAAFAVSGIIAQLLKLLIIEARPGIYLEKMNYPYFIKGVTLHNLSGFPSGHTASAFALVTIIAVLLSNKKWALPLLLIACAIGYSRIYLAQHFLIDVESGALIGVVSAMVCLVLLGRVKWGKNIR